MLKHVNGRERMFSPLEARDTCEALINRLKLFRSPVNGIMLELDIKLRPDLFVDTKLLN